MSNLRDKILAVKDIKSEQVHIDIWGVTVEVRGLTGTQRAILLNDTTNKRGEVDMTKFYPELVVLSTYDPESGDPVFKMGDIDAVAGKAAGAIEQITGTAMQLSGLNPGEVSKNFEDALSESSISS